jgi:hypothetical protein
MNDQPAPSRADLIGRILGYMDKPWKVAAVAALAILAGAGWLIWAERVRLADAFLPVPHHAPILAPADALADAALRLVRIDGAALAQVWAFHIQGNAVRFLAGVNHDGTAWRPADLGLPDRLPAIIESTEAAYLVAILRGSPVCADPPLGRALLLERLAAGGVRRICLIPVPPVSGQVLAIILIAWRELPDKRMEWAAVDAAGELAATLVRQ